MTNLGIHSRKFPATWLRLLSIDIVQQISRDPLGYSVEVQYQYERKLAIFKELTTMMPRLYSVNLQDQN